MALFESFVGAVRAKVVDIISQKMEQGGSQAVSYAKELVPVKTGQLQASISYYWNREAMQLTLVADKPYAALIERRKPYMRPAIAMVGRAFGLANIDIQFPTVPERHHRGAARLFNGNRNIIIGGRKSVKFRR